MSAIFDEFVRIQKIAAYAQTGNEAFLKDLPAPMGYNDPAHLPQPLPSGDPLVFDIYDDQLMRECIGGRLTKPVQALLSTLEQWDTIPKEAVADLVKLELLKLRAAVKEEFQDL